MIQNSNYVDIRFELVSLGIFVSRDMDQYLMGAYDPYNFSWITGITDMKLGI